MPKRSSALIGCAVALLAGCASHPEIVSRQPLWPFEELEIRTTVGTVVGYASRPQAPIERLVVAVQTSPCPAESSANDHDRPLATSGLVWEQFKNDSLFFQFERPGGDAHSIIVRCERADRHDDDWQRAITDSVAALRKQEHLDVPTVYLGIGAGAPAAIATAARDARTGSVVLLSGLMDSSFEAVLDTVQRQRSATTPALLILHAANDQRTPVVRAEQMFQRLQSARWPASLLVFEGTADDFGLSSPESDCFELVARTLGEYVRSASSVAPGSRSWRVACPSSAPTPQHDREIQIERVEPQ